MPNLVVGSGQSIANATVIGDNEYVLLAQGGSVTYGGGTAIVGGGTNAMTIGGQVLGGTNGQATIELNEGPSQITVLPTGSIANPGSSGTAIRLALVSPMGTLHLDNAGYIYGSNYAVEGGTGADFIGNTGTIAGQISLAGGSNTLENSGTIKGFVQSSGSLRVTNSGVIDGSINNSLGALEVHFRGGTVTGGIFGGAGADSLYFEGSTPGAAPFTFDGGAATDTVSFAPFATAVWLDLDYAGANVWTRDDQSLSSGAWRPLARISQFEILIGSAQSDYLSGDNADNTFIYSTGYDTLRGDGGVDTYDLSGALSPVWVDLATGGTNTWRLVNGAWVAVGDVASIEKLIGTAGDDVLRGDASDNIFLPGGGKDTVAGRDGNDKLIMSLSTEADTFDGGNGSDTVDFGNVSQPVWVSLTEAVEVWVRGATSLDSGTWRQIMDLNSVENIVGTVGADFLSGNASDNWLQGGGGDDKLVYTGGLDKLFGDGGYDTADFSPLGYPVWIDLTASGVEAWRRGADLNSGTWTQIADLDQIENLTGTAYGDFLKGDAGYNSLNGLGGDDLLYGWALDDILYYTGGKDLLDGGADADTADFSLLDRPIWVDLTLTSMEDGPATRAETGLRLPTSYPSRDSPEAPSTTISSATRP